MNTRIIDALKGAPHRDHVYPQFADLKVGQPFRWVKENESARRGVCIKLAVVMKGKIGFSSHPGGLDHGWTSLETDYAGTIYSADKCSGTDVIPL